MSAKVVIGAAVTGDDFFDRRATVEEIWNELEKSNVLLVGPRRFGKTSIMQRLRDRPREGVSVVYIDVEHVVSPREFLSVVLERLQSVQPLGRRVVGALARWLRLAGDRVDEVQVREVRVKVKDSEDVDWKELGRGLFHAVGENGNDLVIVLDEFPEMIKRMMRRDAETDADDTSVFLAWFRHLRQEIGPRSGPRFVLGGSICLENLLRRMNALPHINDLSRVNVGPFSDDDAREFVGLLFESEGVGIDGPSIDALVREVGTPVPYFLQILTRSVVTEAKKSGQEVTPSMVSEVYSAYVLGPEYRSHFEHYGNRLREYYETTGDGVSALAGAIAILNDLAFAGEGEERHLYQVYLVATGQLEDMEGFNDLMQLLEAEFYIERDDGSHRCRFVSKMLRDWWRRKHGIHVMTGGGAA